MQKEFTGRHFLIVMVSFFGVVIAVNLLMATLATRTFGGTVVDNSYVASQNYNKWLKQARDQDRLQWQVASELDPSRHVTIRTSGRGGPLIGATIEGEAHHPLGRVPERQLAFSPLGNGVYRSHDPLPEGRWKVRLTVRRDGSEARYLTELRQ